MNRLGTALVSAAALWLAACGSGGSSVQPPPPTGKFSLASLSGTYAFITSGEVFSGATVNPLARVGSFTADGKGGISGGVEDVNVSGVGATPAIAITGGSYTVSADGRGTLTLVLGQNSINFGIVLTSGTNGSIASDGLMIDETSTSSQSSTGSGNFVLQNTASFGSTIPGSAGAYVFDFAGLDGTQAPDSIVGQFTVSSGVVSAGVQDENDNGNIPATPTPTAFSGTMAQDPLHTSTLASNGRGIAALNGIQYVFYIVDAGRVRFLSTSGGMLSGDAVAQPPVANPVAFGGSYVFIVAGTSGSGGITRVGRFTVNGSSLSNILADTNDAGKFEPTDSGSNTSVTLDQANPGRGVLTFTANNLSVPLTFVFYLSSATSGVIQEQSQSSTHVVVDVADGSLVAQTGAPFSSGNITGPYALNWSGLSVQQGGSFATQDEEDLLAQATITSLALSGTFDIFQFTNGVPQTGFGLGGNITLGGDGTGNSGQRSTMSINLHGANPISFVVYVASPQLAFFADSSNSSGPQRIVAGVLRAQQ